MGLTLSLTRQVLDTYLGWHAQVLHDLHESVPFLYDNTVGDGPYNAWVDPLLTNEWQLFGWTNVAADDQARDAGRLHPRRFRHLEPGLPDVPRGHAQRRLAALRDLRQRRRRHRDARARCRTRPPAPGTARTRPTGRVSWSQRNNNNYEQTGLLVSLAFTAENRELLLRNFWEKSKRSITKPEREGPAAYVLPADDRRPGAQAELLRVLQLQHVEISRADKPFTVAVPRARSRSRTTRTRRARRPKDKSPATRTFPAGSYVVRMDQPFSRSADALLDRQYWSPDDPQKHPYDDTGWSFPALFDTEAVRVTDPAGAGGGDEPRRGARPARSGGVTGERPRLRRRPARRRCDVQPPLRARGRHRSKPRPSRSRPAGTTIRAAPGWCGGSPRTRSTAPPRMPACRWTRSPPRRRSRRGRSASRASRCCTPGSTPRPRAGGASASTC